MSEPMTPDDMTLANPSSGIVVGELLTPLEKRVIQQLGAVWSSLTKIVGDGPTREADLIELINHVHAIQHAVMAQAAARAYPTQYRLAGGTLNVASSSKEGTA